MKIIKITFIILLTEFCLTNCHDKVGKVDPHAKITLYQDSTIHSVKRKYDEMDIEKEVLFNSPNDTSNVIIQSSNVRFVIHYFNNKPQGILVQPNHDRDSSLSHFARENKGVFIVLDPDSKNVGLVGYKYLNKSEGADILLDSNGSVKHFTKWEQYNSSGSTYNMKDASNGRIKAYIIKDGEKVDSLLYFKNR
ncbi:MAG: hypothetical protein JST68_24190 [Bacteroidetes bacterium]|nr:hypothetical protein [Bacteroidota bacterium]